MGAATASHTHTAAQVGALPASTTKLATARTIEDVDALFRAGRVKKISICEGDEMFVHEDYTIRIGCGRGEKERVLGNIGHTSADGQAELVTWVQMAQSTPQERMMQSQQETLDALLIGALMEEVKEDV